MFFVFYVTNKRYGKTPFHLFTRIAVWFATRINALVDYAAKHDVTCQPTGGGGGGGGGGGDVARQRQQKNVVKQSTSSTVAANIQENRMALDPAGEHRPAP
ncbi:hypothetical protein K0M31_007509 [Melipona bicolor]|uniref:Uncharacterized protein n=1 Tax=Melipona bicolor TaxID=60889 RepID=A0AA40KVR2_9HYME|nr:hypothetical protein K0M31_007509 [Melipona bicolor]